MGHHSQKKNYSSNFDGADEEAVYFLLGSVLKVLVVLFSTKLSIPSLMDVSDGGTV